MRLFPISDTRPSKLKDMAKQRTVEFAEDRHGSPSNTTFTRPSRSTGHRARNQKTRRPKTTYNIAHPPPAGATRSKILLRPKVLLQLQKITLNARSVPAFEVLSAAAFAVKAGQTIATLCPGKARIRPEDLVVLQGQDYASGSKTSTERTDWSSRHVIGVICRRRAESKASVPHTEICLEDGIVWEANAISNGGYEFVSQRGDGLTSTARWVRKHPSKSTDRLPRLIATSEESKAEDRSFMFTKITPDMRQHPVIGLMNRTKLDVYDHYCVPSTPNTDQTRLPKRPSRHSSSSSFDGLVDDEGSVNIRTESSLRDLILVSGIWVAFREGWSNSFRYEEEQDQGSHTASPPKKFLHRRTPSNQTLSTSSESGATQLLANDSEDTLTVRAKLIRTGARFLHRSSSSDVLSSIKSTQDASAYKTPRRSISTGVAFIRKVNRISAHGTDLADNHQPLDSLPPSAIGLGIDRSEAMSSPDLVSTSPPHSPETSNAFPLDYNTRLEDLHEDSEDLDDDDMSEDENHESRTRNEVQDVDQPTPGSGTSAEPIDQKQEANFLYKNLINMFVTLKRTSGMA